MIWVVALVHFTALHLRLQENYLLEEKNPRNPRNPRNPKENLERIKENLERIKENLERIKEKLAKEKQENKLLSIFNKII